MYCAMNAYKIVGTRPDLEPIITFDLLELNSELYFHKHKELVKAAAIQSFIEYYRTSEMQQDILSFVHKQKKAAVQNLEKWQKCF